MVAIPLPFIVSMLLIITAILMYEKQNKEINPSFIFLILCAVSTAIVGLRWSVDIALLRFIQPVFASFIPIMAWYCFANAHHLTKFSRLHFTWPVLITFASLLYPIVPVPIDLILTIVYVYYGGLLIRSSLNTPEEVRLSNIQQVANAERVTGGMLLFSAAVDTFISLDFWFFNGESITSILSLSYLLLMPIMAIAIVTVGLNTFQVVSVENKNTTTLKEAPAVVRLSAQEAQQIVDKIDGLMMQQQLFLDLDLTLTRLSKKLLIPARQISVAVNQVHGKNISRVINEYRIAYAKTLLSSSEDSITQIYLDSGFQTKSNFNREFVRITGKTPSQFRRELD